MGNFSAELYLITANTHSAPTHVIEKYYVRKPTTPSTTTTAVWQQYSAVFLLQIGKFVVRAGTHMETAVWLETRTQGSVAKYLDYKGSRRQINAKKTIAHDDVTQCTMARKILKKINDLSTRIELTL